MKPAPLFLLTVLLASGAAAPAGIISVTETGRGADLAATPAPGFDEDANAYVDRTATTTPPGGHQHNGPAFNSATGALSTTGDLAVGLPPYLIGHDYVRFANNARDNAGYSAIVTTDTPSTFYVLIDNRINGPNIAVASSATTDPVLGGSLQWVLDGSWERMNTGISPNGLPDYTAIDETGNGTGAGVGLNNFMSIYKFPAIATSVTVKNGLYTGNNIAVVAVPTAPPPVPIVSYQISAATTTPGTPVLLSWLISPTATTASIDQGVGNILLLNDANGAGSVQVNPAVNTTYTLTVNTPTGNNTLAVSVAVLPIAGYTASRQRIEAGESVVLNWRVRPDAVVTIDGIGSVNAQTDANGTGTLTVQPAVTRDYVLRAEAEAGMASATIGVVVRPAGQSFALIDIGATGGRGEPGSVNGRTIGAAAAGTNLTDLFAVPLLSDTGVEFTLALDATGTDDFPLGGLDWRDRGDSPLLPLNRLSEDFVKNNAGLIRVSLGQLPAGTYDVISYHLDPDNSQTEAIRVLVSDASGTAVEAAAIGDASWPGHPDNTGAPTLARLTTGLTVPHEIRFRITSNGTDEVRIYFDSTLAPIDRELPLNGLWLSMVPPRPVDPTWALIDLGASTGQVEPGAANLAVIGNANGANGSNLAAVTLTSRTGVDFQVALDNLDPNGGPVGGLDWRDRGDAPDVPLGWMAEDFVKNNLGLIRVTLSGLPAGIWQIHSYHLDPTLSQAAGIRVVVTDAARTAGDTLLTADSSFVNDAAAPQLNGLSPGLIRQRSVAVEVTSNGTDEIILFYDSTQNGGDLEVPLSGLRITPAVVTERIPVTAITRTVTGATASFAVTFTSKPDKTYTVYGAADTTLWGLPLTTTLAATGTSTTFTETGIPAATPRRFYQIRQN